VLSCVKACDTMHDALQVRSALALARAALTHVAAAGFRCRSPQALNLLFLLIGNVVPGFSTTNKTACLHPPPPPRMARGNSLQGSAHLDAQNRKRTLFCAWNQDETRGPLLHSRERLEHLTMTMISMIIMMLTMSAHKTLTSRIAYVQRN
jgi:hypothetical protein